MITYSIIQKSQLEGTHRLDAEYYQPEYLKKSEKIKSLGYIALQDIAYVTDGEHGSPIWDAESGVKYYSAQHVKNGLIDDVDIKTISQIINKRNKRSQLQVGDVLLSTVGTVGFAGLVQANNLPANIDRHVARIVLNKKTLDPEFLVAYLNSSYGRFQTIRESTGNVQLNLFIEKIKTLLVPNSNKATISSLVKKAFSLKEESEKLYSQAENLLLEELGLKDFQIEDNLSFVVNLSDVKNAKRVDAEYFQPKYDKLLERIKQKGHQILTDVIENISAKFDPTKTPDSKFKYVELANINSSIGIIDGYTEVLGKETPSRAKRLLKKGDVIVSSVEGSLEKIALADDEHGGYIASTGFFQFRSKELLPEVILVLAKSIVLQWQFQKHCAGTILTAVPSESLQKMFIPTISKPTQEKIADLVRKSHEARKKSKELLEEAKRNVEEMIEKGVQNKEEVISK